MECDPGAEAQVDFGSGASVVDDQGKRWRTHVLRVGLTVTGHGRSVTMLRSVLAHLFVPPVRLSSWRRRAAAKVLADVMLCLDCKSLSSQDLVPCRLLGT